MLSIKRIANPVASVPRRFVSILDVHDAFSEKHPDIGKKINNTFDYTSPHYSSDRNQYIGPQSVNKSGSSGEDTAPRASHSGSEDTRRSNIAGVKAARSIWFGFHI